MAILSVLYSCHLSVTILCCTFLGNLCVCIVVTAISHLCVCIVVTAISHLCVCIVVVVTFVITVISNHYVNVVTDVSQLPIVLALSFCSNIYQSPFQLQLSVTILSVLLQLSVTSVSVL